MFTGIVQAVGRIVGTRPLQVECPTLDLGRTRIGDSVCVQGVCLTVTAITGSGFTADVSAETLRVTTGLDRAGEVNLEKALAFGEALGGHLVAGHVDGVGEVSEFSGGLLSVRAPAGLGRYIARKGSISVDGVSLTINRADAERFEVNLIPHTLQVTTLKRLHKGARVNLARAARRPGRRARRARETARAAIAWRRARPRKAEHARCCPAAWRAR
jgi:riboflavin synthase